MPLPAHSTFATATSETTRPRQTVALAMEITEGQRYRWGNIRVIGLDPKIETILRARLPKYGIVNPKLIRDFYKEYKSSLPVGASPETAEWKFDQQRAIVDMTLDFSTDPVRSYTRASDTTLRLIGTWQTL
jgi:hypothetical protein